MPPKGLSREGRRKKGKKKDPPATAILNSYHIPNAEKEDDQ